MEFLMLGYELLCTMFPACVAMGIFHHIYKRKNILVSGWHYAWLAVFAFYLFGVFHYTGSGTVFDAIRYGVDLNPAHCNFLPFSDPDMDAVAYGLNVVLFVPLGFFLPMIWPALNKMKYALLSGVSLSLVIEASQFLNSRAPDVDDLIMNTAGAAVGFLLFRLFLKLTKRTARPSGVYSLEAFLLTVSVFGFRFFFYNEFGMAKLLYGF